MGNVLGSVVLGLVLMTQHALADSAAMVLRDGFDGTDFSDEGGLYYRENAEQAAGRVEFQGEVTRDGTGRALQPFGQCAVRPGGGRLFRAGRDLGEDGAARAL